MKINQNIASMNAQRHMFNTNLGIDRTMERLSSGLRINTAADDASGLAISKKMSAQNKGLYIATQNAQDGMALYKIAEGSLNNVSNMLTRMEELTTRAANGTLTDGDRSNIQDEIDQLLDQIKLISQTTEYNTLKLLDGTLQPQITTNITTGTQNTIELAEIPATVNSGTFSLNVIQVASAATIVNTPASSASSVTGTITVNGTNVQIEAGDNIAQIAAKINEVNARTNVIASYDLTTRGFALYSGIIDDDATNIPGASNAIGYALVGSKYEITISGDNNMLSSIGLTATTVSGTDAIAELDDIRLLADGNHLKMTSGGVKSEGLELNLDLYKGGNGVYIQENVIGSAAFVHTSSAGDQATFTVDVSNRMRLQIGANYNQQIYNGLPDIQAKKLGVGASSKFRDLSELDVKTMDNANISLKVIQQSIIDISAHRSKIGANMNRLEYTITTLKIQRENMTAAQSRIEDADMAEEMTAFTKQQILIQAGTSMLAQANARPQQVLQLLGG
jgi:flagellin